MGHCRGGILENAEPLTVVRGSRFWVSRRHDHRPDSGFTLLELTLVMLATSIVVALGVSAYSTYSARTQIATSVDETAAVQRLVVAAFKSNGIPPFDAAAAGIDETAHDLLAGTYIQSLGVLKGRIELRFGTSAHAAIAGKTLALTPFETAEEEVVWVCGNEPPGVGLKPLGFAGGASEPTRIVTTIERRYLPTSCR